MAVLDRRAYGDLWIGDVGRHTVEEVDAVHGPRAAAGMNFGWPYLEGTSTRRNGAPADVVAPLVAYGHGERCAVTGGVVYRGKALPGLAGAYVYSDLCDGILRAVAAPGGVVAAEQSFDDVHAGYPVSISTDLAGELYVCSFDASTVFRVLAA